MRGGVLNYFPNANQTTASDDDVTYFSYADNKKIYIAHINYFIL